MARAQSPRLNLLGVVSLIIGVAAFVATKVPLHGYGPSQIASLGIAAGVLGFLVSIVFRRSGSGVPVLGVLLSLGALALAGYDNGTLPALWARLHPAQIKPPPAIIVPPKPNVPAEPEPPHLHSIFDTDVKPGGASSVTNVPPPVVNEIRSPAPGLAAPVPPVTQPPMPTLSEARAKLDAATAAVEKSLSNDPAYIQAKDGADAADARRKAALAENGPGSPEVQQASSQWLDARSKLKKLIDAALARDPDAEAAQQQLRDLRQMGILGNMNRQIAYTLHPHRLVPCRDDF